MTKEKPHKLDIEQVIIGAMLIDQQAVRTAIEVLKDKQDIFYDLRHKIIYKAAYELELESKGVDLLTITDKLKQNGDLQKIGNELYLIELTQKISSGAHTEYYCRLIIQDYIKRTSISVGNDLATKGYKEDQDCFELLDESYKELDNITEYLQAKTEKDFAENIDDVITSFDEKEVRVPSGIKEVNLHTNGYQAPDLIILAARPGMGKTALVLSESLAQAKQGYAVGICSMEMSDRQLTGRIISNHCSIDNQKIANKRVDQSQIRQIQEGVDSIKQLPIYINDQAAQTIMEIKVQAKKWKREKNLKILYVDYIQLMRSPQNVNREQQISEFSRGLKGIAKELDIPVVALSQLSRKVEERALKLPMLSDLRESGAIEQDADVVCFIYRPEYYDMKEFEDGTSSENRAQLIWEKYRNGSTGSKLVGCNLQYMRYTDDIEEFVTTEFETPF